MTLPQPQLKRIENMTNVKTTYYIAFNEGRDEGFISTNKRDVLKALGRMRVGGSEAALGCGFRECYEDQKGHMKTVEI